jgi:hypothetical protein
VLDPVRAVVRGARQQEVVARTIADTLEAMDPRYPPAEPGLDGVVVPD